MKSYFLLLLFIAGFSVKVSAMIDPYYKEVMQRGYTIVKDSAVMPDGSRCLISDFNNGLCGKKFFDEPYCVQQGNYVWVESSCCDGLVAYLPVGYDGQPTCRKKGKIDFYQVIGSGYFWLSVLGFTAFVFGTLQLIRKLKQN